MKCWGFIAILLVVVMDNLLTISLAGKSGRVRRRKCRAGQTPNLDDCVNRKRPLSPTSISIRALPATVEQPRTDGPHCPPCAEISCLHKQQYQCEGGLTTGYCGCCRVCAKLEGQECGGRHLRHGKCDKNLECTPLSLLPKRSARNPTIVHPERFGVVEPPTEELEGICKPVSQCRPQCTPEFCESNRKAICSAKNTAIERRDCQGQCQHTSCKACFFQEPPSCKKCAPDDLKCIKHFGKCVKRKLFKKKRMKNMDSNSANFVCWVPECKAIV